MDIVDETLRLTQYARGGGCACKIPPGELESALAGIFSPLLAPVHELLIRLESGDDAAAVRLSGDTAIIATTDFFTPVIDDPYDWGRIAAANALSDVYAMGGDPVLAVNLLAWPRDLLPMSIDSEVLRGGFDVQRCPDSRSVRGSRRRQAVTTAAYIDLAETPCQPQHPHRKRARHIRPRTETDLTFLTDL